MHKYEYDKHITSSDRTNISKCIAVFLHKKYQTINSTVKFQIAMNIKKCFPTENPVSVLDIVFLVLKHKNNNVYFKELYIRKVWNNHRGSFVNQYYQVGRKDKTSKNLDKNMVSSNSDRGTTKCSADIPLEKELQDDIGCRNDSSPKKDLQDLQCECLMLPKQDVIRMWLSTRNLRLSLWAEQKLSSNDIFHSIKYLKEEYAEELVCYFTQYLRNKKNN